MDQKSRIQFDGTGGKLFKLSLVNILLSILTLGIYYFWAKVKIQKFIYAGTKVYGERFDYHATGKEKFIAFLKALPVLAGIAGIYYGSQQLMNYFNVPIEYSQSILIIFFYLIFILIGPLLIVAKSRFTLSRSSWNNVHFKFRGKVKPLYKIMLKGIFLSIITIGLYSPWFICELQKYMTENSNFGNMPFKYTGKGKELIKYFILIFIMTIIFIGIMANIIITTREITKKNLQDIEAMQKEKLETQISIHNVDNKKFPKENNDLKKDDPEITEDEEPTIAEDFEEESDFPFNPYVLAALPFLYLAFIIYTFYLKTKLYKYHWENTHIQDKPIKCTIKFGEYLGNIIAANIILAISFGIAAPWAYIMVKKYELETIYLPENIDFQAIQAAPAEGSAFAEAFEEAGDFLDTLADFIG
ncbi:MAG: YjgN family protein [Spirochaetia bacterium]|nr:YjgN family protein [Spirochaetia bacterium]